MPSNVYSISPEASELNSALSDLIETTDHDLIEAPVRLKDGEWSFLTTPPINLSRLSPDAINLALKTGIACLADDVGTLGFFQLQIDRTFSGSQPAMACLHCSCHPMMSCENR